MDSYSATILKNVLHVILQIFLYLETFECNTTSDWLNQTVQPFRSCVTFQFAILGEKDKECSWEWFGEYWPWSLEFCILTISDD